MNQTTMQEIFSLPWIYSIRSWADKSSWTHAISTFMLIINNEIVGILNLLNFKSIIDLRVREGCHTVGL